MTFTCAEFFQFGTGPEALDSELRKLDASVHADGIARTIFPRVLDVFDRVRVCTVNIALDFLTNTADNNQLVFARNGCR